MVKELPRPTAAVDKERFYTFPILKKVKSLRIYIDLLRYSLLHTGEVYFFPMNFMGLRPSSDISQVKQLMATTTIIYQNWGYIQLIDGGWTLGKNLFTND